MSERDWEITLGVTCTDTECESLMVEVLDFVNDRHRYGAAVAASDVSLDGDES
jgi:hypothetical protein